MGIVRWKLWRGWQEKGNRLTSLVLTVRETLRYRGAIGQWSWVLHRLTGVGVVLFLALHVIDTSWAVFYPDLYVKAIAAYQSPLFTIGEFGLVFAVVYHAFNGIRIIIFDYKPELWRHQAQAAIAVLVLTLLVLAPVFLGMASHVVDFYFAEAAIASDKLLDVVVFSILEQLPFIAGFVGVLAAAIVLAAAYSLISGEADARRPVSAGEPDRALLVGFHALERHLDFAAGLRSSGADARGAGRLRYHGGARSRRHHVQQRDDRRRA